MLGGGWEPTVKPVPQENAGTLRVGVTSLLRNTPRGPFLAHCKPRASQEPLSETSSTPLPVSLHVVEIQLLFLASWL